MAERHRAAIDIVDPGACNPSGIAHAIIKACSEARDEGRGTRDDPAVRLMVTQLAWVCRANFDTDDYGALLAKCRRLRSRTRGEVRVRAITLAELMALLESCH